MLVYGKVCRRREGVYRTREQAAPIWRALCQARAKFHKKFAAELEELEACAGDLRSTITRVRARPLQRYKFWMRLVSSRFALGRSLACYCLVLLVLIVSSCYIDPPLWAPRSNISFDTFGLWQAVDGRVLLANWMAASFAGVAMPLLYFVRRTELSREHGRQIREWREFAAADPDRLIGQRHAEAPETSRPTRPSRRFSMNRSSLEPGSVSSESPPSATVDEVKQAYKVLVNQNHPDRVFKMSAAFRELAEGETKKLNIAYAEALAYLGRNDAWSDQEMTRAA